MNNNSIKYDYSEFSPDNKKTSQEYDYSEFSKGEQQPIKQSLLSSMANSAPTQFLVGASSGTTKPIFELGNLINKVIGQPQVKQILPDQVSNAGKLGTMFGELGGLVAGGEGLDAARVGVKSLPYVGKLAAGLEGSTARGIAKRSLGNALYGALSNPDAPVTGGIINAVASPIMDITGHGITKALSSIKPGEIVSKLQELLSPESINKRKDVGSMMMKDVFNKLPKEDIYGAMNNKLGEENDYRNPIKTYKDLTAGGIVSTPIEHFIPNKLRLAHDNFMGNKTAENAHLLYKQYGSEIGKYNNMEARSGTIDAVNNTLRDTFGIARKAIKNDLNSYMSSKDPELFQKFLDTNKYYQSNVYPHEQLSLALRSLGEKPTAEKVLNTLSKKESLMSDVSERTGRDQHFPKEVSDLMPTLEKRIQGRNLAQRGAGMLLGASLGHHLMPTMELAGGAAGLYLAPILSKMASQVKPLNVPKNTLNVSSDILKKALLSIMANKG